jgi:four helix bundle protein
MHGISPQVWVEMLERKRRRQRQAPTKSRSSDAASRQEKPKKRIASFRDVDIYQKSYMAAVTVIKQVVPKLPGEEMYDLASQLRRSSKAIPRLIAEGYSKKHQLKGFQKYLDDALAESNETIVSLSQARDIYGVEKDICSKMIDEYEIISRQIYKLALVWTSFGRRKPKDDYDQASQPQPDYDQ